MMTTMQQNLLGNVLTEAHRSFQRELHARAFYKIQDPSVGEDLVQQTFMKTWMYLVKGGEVHIMRAFLHHILNGLIIDEYRRRKTVSLDLLLEKDFDLDTGDTGRLFNILDGKSALLLIEELPIKYREVMYMRYVRMLSLKEIGLITTQTTNTIAVQVHRGLKRLRILYNHA